MGKTGANAPCTCGSWKKFKKCCRDAPKPTGFGVLSAPPQGKAIQSAAAQSTIGDKWLMRVSLQPVDADLLLRAAQHASLRASWQGGAVLVDWEILRERMSFDIASKKAEVFIPLLNGLMRMLFPAFGGAKLDAIIGNDGNGRRISVSWTNVHIASKQSIEEAFRYLREESETLGRLFELAKENGAVAEALFFGRTDEPFFNLYKVFEIIRDEVGGKPVEFAGENDIDRFTRAANDPEISGVFARHSKRSNSSRPADAMGEQEARTLIAHMLSKWTASLIAKSRGASSGLRAG
jgi:hypothetical protein